MARNTTMEGRTSLAIDQETKAVFDWSMKDLNSKNVSQHLRKLLQDEHDAREWSDLVRKAQNKMIICERHNKPTTMFCLDCGIALCPECDVKAHLDIGHDVLNFCRTHQTGYRGSCLMCEKDRWEGIVEVPRISAQELYDELKKGTPLVIIDLRNHIEYEEGHLPRDYPYRHTEFKYISLPMTQEFKELSDLVEQNKYGLIVTMGQSMPKKDKAPTGSARGFIAGAQIKVMFKAKNVRYLDGGWSAFHYLNPKIVNEEHKKDQCRICRFYGRK